jgi:hypothetical protein
MWLLLIVLLLPLPAWAAEVCVQIPNAIVSKANAVCSAHIATQNVDTDPTAVVCLESLIRERVMDLAQSKIQTDAGTQARADAEAEMAVIQSAWPEVLDLDVCGDNEQDGDEECDGTWDTACGGEVCLPECYCYVEPPPVDPNEVMP